MPRQLSAWPLRWRPNSKTNISGLFPPKIFKKIYRLRGTDPSRKRYPRANLSKRSEQYRLRFNPQRQSGLWLPLFWSHRIFQKTCNLSARALPNTSKLSCLKSRFRLPIIYPFPLLLCWYCFARCGLVFLWPDRSAFRLRNWLKEPVEWLMATLAIPLTRWVMMNLGAWLNPLTEWQRTFEPVVNNWSFRLACSATKI